ncbi:hypothetical protein K2173_015592 [Erythroxylum novogranatense]|uniref:Expansin-like EG45 domain-containing protein n=1 Tax=Erythroxylum novogranatense TaxID=1862640 RepID=A0AAV8SEL7_9ROSI|nr:hypothetical protein K2173_015592 [Erythroxylum novogranatense]
MLMPQPLLLCRPLFLSCLIISHLLYTTWADVGIAGRYGPPYLPTACYGGDSSEFPTNNMFAAVGDGLWDNSASCGRQYLVRCISATAGFCTPGRTIQVKIVDHASASSATIVLSLTAFTTITNSTSSFINIEFQQNLWNQINFLQVDGCQALISFPGSILSSVLRF